MLLEDHYVVTLQILLQELAEVPPPRRLHALQTSLKTRLQLCRDGMAIYKCLLDAVTQAGPAAQTNSPQRWLKAIHEEYAIGMAMHQPLLDMAMNAASIEALETSVKNHRFKPKIPVPTDLEERRRQSYPLVMRHFARRRLQRLGAAICKT